jgi:hypothetical protein
LLDREKNEKMNEKTVLVIETNDFQKTDEFRHHHHHTTHPSPLPSTPHCP